MASGKWSQFSLVEQLANIGSEVGRSIRWFKANDKERFESSFIRALELFELTLADNRWKGRRKEIARSKEVFCSLLTEPEFFKEIDHEFDSLNEYFLQFGIAANAKKGR